MTLSLSAIFASEVVDCMSEGARSNGPGAV
ncbi:MAG: hypothetical protein JWN59_169 [Sphingomonas bacterium]|nr:hypothetical protein [Sphingomonas bacterium]